MTDVLIKRELLERVAQYTPSIDRQEDRARAISELRSILECAPRQPEGEGLDERMKAAGMLSVAELLAGAPLDAFMKHAGVNDLATFAEWLEMRRAECLSMHALYDLGERDKGDDLYEWTIAHSAVFAEVHVNFKAAHADAQRAIAEWQQRCQYNADTAHDVAAERDTLRQQRDKLAGLLELCANEFKGLSMTHDLPSRICAALAEVSK